MKFDTLISEQMSRLLEAPIVDPSTPPANGTAPQPNDPSAASKLPPAPTPDAPEAVQPMTPEGKVFLIDLARKALAFDPHQLPEFDRDVLGDPVTAESADGVLKDIQRILGTN